MNDLIMNVNAAKKSLINLRAGSMDDKSYVKLYLELIQKLHAAIDLLLAEVKKSLGAACCDTTMERALACVREVNPLVAYAKDYIADYIEIHMPICIK